MIRRSDGSPLYNLAVAVDDRDMGITHVVRGQDHVSNTPRQLMILRALGAEPPVYAHIPLLHGPDGKKLSKRHGAASVQELRDAGYLPEAVRNYIALLGWGYDETTTFMTDRRAGGALLARAGVEATRGVRRAEAALDERALPARAARATTCAAARGAAGRECCRGGGGDQPGEDADAGGLLAARRLPRGAQEFDEKAWEKVMSDGAPERLRGPRGARGRRAVRPEPSRRRCAAWSSGSR